MHAAYTYIWRILACVADLLGPTAACSVDRATLQILAHTHTHTHTVRYTHTHTVRYTLYHYIYGIVYTLYYHYTYTFSWYGVSGTGRGGVPATAECQDTQEGLLV